MVCASRLEARGAVATVFDTGKHAPGGRMASRVVEVPGWPEGGRVTFDHAAQYVPVSASTSDPRFVQMTEAWVAQGAARAWGAGGLVRVGPDGGKRRPMLEEDVSALVGVGGMRALARHLAQGLDLRGDTWVDVLKYEPLAGRGRGEGAFPPRREGWRVGRRGRETDVFDAVVIAHNGKCADRLLRRTGAGLATEAMKRLRLSAMWVCLVAFDGPVGADFDAADVEGSEVLRFAANQSAKGVAQQAAMVGGGECWTLISTDVYGRKNKVPQEAVPPEKSKQVFEELTAAFFKAAGVDPRSAPAVAFHHCQLWGAALGANTPRTPAVWCPESRVGIAGDWLHLGSIEGAAVSGLELADAIVDFSEAAASLPHPDASWRNFARTIGREETERPYARVASAGILEAVLKKTISI